MSGFEQVNKLAGRRDPPDTPGWPVNHSFRHITAESGPTQSPYPNPSLPEQPPFKVIPAPPHVSNELWQTSYYDATSHAPISDFVQRPAGPCDINTGEMLDGDWPESRIWKQV